MSALIRYLPTAALLLPWLIELATWLVARSLNMPPSLVEAAGIFVFLKAQAFENYIGKSLRQQDSSDGNAAYRDYVTAGTTEARSAPYPACSCGMIQQQRQEKRT